MTKESRVILCNRIFNELNAIEGRVGFVRDPDTILADFLSKMPDDESDLTGFGTELLEDYLGAIDGNDPESVFLSLFEKLGGIDFDDFLVLCMNETGIIMGPDTKTEK